jgi:LytS/YehU family sensor histidine kinase
LINKDVWPESDTPQKAYSFNHILVVFLIGIRDVALVTTIKLTADWIFEKRRSEQLQEVQLRTELNFLKTQIQPHFFFNTLNNLYALSIEKSDKAPEMILKLSEIMQYVLYDAKEPNISLLKEINYIHSYLELEELRFGNTVKYNLDIVGNINDVFVPPLLFLPFIENCFKHGTRENDHMTVEINFKKIKEQLFFSVKNNFNGQSSILKNSKHGIGILNVKRRLKLLYQENYILKTDIFEQEFNVNLKIPI